MFKRILIPIDGSEFSTQAVRQGVQLAKEIGARVAFLNVVMPFHYFTARATMQDDTAAAYAKHSRQHAERILGECEQAARSAGVPSEGSFVVNEHPYEEIVKAAKDADLVVMASHGRRGAERLLLGSETHKTITHGETPVLVIR